MTKTKKKIITGTLIVIILLLTISTSQAGDFNDLNNIISNTPAGQTLNLTENYTDTEGIQIIIWQNITIDGKGHTINFNQQNEINNILIEPSHTVTLNNITLINGQSSNGGAIYNNQSNLTINNSTLNQNIASQYGGAIYNNGGIVTINNSTLNNNTASTGGAIYKYYGVLTINNSTLNNNKANTNGGAIHNQGNLTINNSTLNNNKANTNGGAIRNYYGTVTINNTKLNNNTASTGGAMYNSGSSSVLIVQSVLVNNTATTGSAIYRDDGSVVADGNYWGNLNPTTDNLVNFVVGDYYRFSLTGDTSTIVGNEITLTSVFGLNTTDTTPWTGPTLNTSNATFTSSPTTATLTPNGDTVKFKPSAAGQYTVTANKAGGISTITITVKLNSSLTIDTVDLTMINGALRDTSNNNPISGVNVTINISGEDYNVTTDSDGKYTFEHNIIHYGNYPITVIFNGTNTDYADSITTGALNVSLVENVTVDLVTSMYGENAITNGTFTTNNITENANITVKINDTEVANDLTDADGKVSFIIPGNYVVGEYELKFYHNGELLNTTIWTVSPANSILSVDATSTLVNGTLVDGDDDAISGATITMTVNNGTAVTSTTNSTGEFTFVLTETKYGVYNIVVSFTGANYNSSTATTSFNIPLVENVTVDLVNSMYGENAITNGTFTSNNVTSGANITVKINDTEVANDLTDADGKVSFNIPGTYNAGSYTLSFYNNGKLLNTTTWTVNKLTSNVVMTTISPIYEGYTLKIVVTLKSSTKALANKIVTFTGYRGKTYTAKTNTNGQAILYIKSAITGKYTIKAQFKGDTNYKTSNTASKPTTVKGLTITKTTPRNGQKGYKSKTIVITFNQNIKKYSNKYYAKIYVKNLKTKRKMSITKKIIRNKLYITIKTRRTSKTYYQIYIPRYSIVNTYKKTIIKAKSIKFRT